METKRQRILVADDEEGLRLSMAGILELEGHEVVTASNGLEAVERVKEHPVDIAFLDIKMPGINGVETFKQIKKYSPETIVIMMTAFALNDLIKEAISEGAYACISKPFDMDRIISTIKEVSEKPFVMVIDDDPALCDLVYERLKDNGFNVVTKLSGNDGLELVKRKIPDIVLLDVVMDGMDGVTTLKKLKEMLGENCPKTIIMSAQDLQSKFEEAKQLGAVDCLRKPLNINGLKDTIYKLLEQHNKLKICIVDDDRNSCESLKNALSSNGYDVDVAYSGKEVVEKIKNEVFKVVILDMRNPELNGIEIYEQVKKANPGLGVVFINGHSSEKGFDETAKRNNYLYLHKPFEPEELLGLINEVSKKSNDEDSSGK